MGATGRDRSTHLALVRDDAEVARRAMAGELSGVLLHEVANLLQGLDLALRTLSPFVRLHAGGEARVLAALDAAHEVSQRVTATYRALRPLVRADASAVDRQPIGPLIARAGALCTPYARRRVTLRQSALPAVDVLADEALVTQALVMLLQAAIDATPVGGVVDVEVTVGTGAVAIAVIDDGPGLDAVAATELQLGLAGHVARVHGGGLDVESCSGRGARVVLRLPAAPSLALGTGAYELPIAED